MRRAVARGRVFPQSFSTDRRYGRLSLKAVALFPLMWVNADDQGRLSGDPEEVKYTACPNIDHITKADMPALLDELEKNELIKVYSTTRTNAVQMLDWWDGHRPQWAWPSDFPPPDGWVDHLRYKKGAKEVVTTNWFSQVSTQVSGETRSGEVSGEDSGEVSGETSSKRESNKEKRLPRKREMDQGTGRGRGNSPERSGEGSGEKKPSPSLAGGPLFQCLVDTFPKAFGRMPDSRETAQLRDLGTEISSAGAGATAQQVYDAYKEACGQNKFSISYLRAILLDWLGIPRGKSP